MNWLDLAPEEAQSAIEDWVAARDEPPYRVRQILPRLWQRPVSQWAGASELPRPLAAVLDQAQPLVRPIREQMQRSKDGTVKFLWRLADGAAVESVMIPEGRRRTLCISSQVGCAFGCVFCATGRMGFGRHLDAWEITAQVREMLLDPEFGMPTNVVFMGMGEPLHNWSGVDRALTILNDPRGLGLGARHITVSTVGLVPGLKRLAQRREQFQVALSLHAAASLRRLDLMPVERKYPLPQVLDALREFRRRVTLEYVLIRDRNDTPDDAERLAPVARSLDALINLLPLHPGGSPGLEPTSPTATKAFARRLRELGAKVTVRRSRGLDIAAACGQLRIVADGPGVLAEDHREVDQEPRVGIDHDPSHS